MERSLQFQCLSSLRMMNGANPIWSYDWQRDALSRLTFDPGWERQPTWSPKGEWLVFNSARAGVGNLYLQRADGTGDAIRLTESKNVQRPASWHPDGKYLAYNEAKPQTASDILILPMEGDETSGWKPGKPITFLATNFVEDGADFFPDGRWIAYHSNESGRFEAYVRPFPGPGGKWQVSTSAGVWPSWSPNGKELFYRSGDQAIMVATYSIENDAFRVNKPQMWSKGPLFDRGNTRNLTLHPDGKRFAVVKAAGSDAANKLDRVVFIQNIFQELRRIDPAQER